MSGENRGPTSVPGWLGTPPGLHGKKVTSDSRLEMLPAGSTTGVVTFGTGRRNERFWKERTGKEKRPSQLRRCRISGT